MTVQMSAADFWRLRAMLAETQIAIADALKQQQAGIASLAAVYNFPPTATKFSWTPNGDVTVE